MRRALLSAAVLCLGVTASDAGVSHEGGRGLWRIAAADNMGPGRLTIGLFADYWTHDLPGDQTERDLLGTIGVTYGVADFLEIAGALPVHLLYLSDREPNKIINHPGDLRLRGKLTLHVSPLVRTGIMGTLTLPTGDEGRGYTGYPGPWGREKSSGAVTSLLTADVGSMGGAPLRIHANVGWQSEPDTDESEAYDLLLMGAGLEIPTPEIAFYVELSTEQQYDNDTLGFGENPIRVTPGLRLGDPLVNTMELAASFYLHDRDAFETPEWEISLGFTLTSGLIVRDADADGVPDHADQCPHTPSGAIVDERGCPIDSDWDGIPDGLDQCPDTPRAARVDPDGCPEDSDNDGVPDGIDMCPDTEPPTVVDSRGCPKDSDGDGVPDGIDRCPDTPPNTVVNRLGCAEDSDADGVPDGLDRCPDTPYGAAVDGMGCPKDSDGDGVPDGIDKCPDTPYGASVNEAGCAEDADGDGVPDGIDRCADTPYGAIVDPRGCPKDTDGDGVLDGIDRCPDSAPGVQVDSRGCPKRFRLEGVNFEFASAKLLPEARPALQSAGEILKDNPGMRVRIEGYTDSVGSDSYNRKLSQERADAVRVYLIEHFDVDPQRIEARGFGEDNPVASNSTEEGRAKNRRIEFVILEP